MKRASGIADRSLDREAAADLRIGLQVEALGHRGSQIVGELQAAVARDVDVLLNVVPLDVVDAGRDLHSVVEVVLRADLVALGGVVVVGLAAPCRSESLRRSGPPRRTPAAAADCSRPGESPWRTWRSTRSCSSAWKVKPTFGVNAILAIAEPPDRYPGRSSRSRSRSGLSEKPILANAAARRQRQSRSVSL